MAKIYTTLCLILVSVTPALLGVASAEDQQDPAVTEVDKTPAPSKSDMEQALGLYNEGQAHFHGERFAKAAYVFEQSYALHARAQTLFAWAQAERLGQSCDLAKKLFGRFVLTETSEANRSAVQKLIGLCKSEGKEAAESSSPQGPADEPVESGSTQDDANSALSPLSVTGTNSTRLRKSSRSTPWYTDLLADSLLLGGSVGVGVGVVFWLSSRTALQSAENETQSHSEALANYDQAKSKRTIALVSGSLGLGLFAGAIFRIATRSSGDESLQVGAQLDSERAGLWVRGGF